MNIKYFLTGILTFGLIFSAACHSSPRNAKVREKIVDCDADLSMNELHKCIEKESEKYNPAPKDKNAYVSRGVLLEDYVPTKIDRFKSIKNCYEKDRCTFVFPAKKTDGIITAYESTYRYDELNNRFNLIVSSQNYLQVFGPPAPECSEHSGCYRRELFRIFFNKYKYIESNIRSRDFIVAIENGKKNIYAVALTAVALDKKYLIITNIMHLSPLSVEEILNREGYKYPYNLQKYIGLFGGDWQEEANWFDITLPELKKIKATDGGHYFIRDKKKSLPKTYQELLKTTVDLKNDYHVIKGWRFYTIKDSKHINTLDISLDKRTNPKKIYIKQDADVYEIDIKH